MVSNREVSEDKVWVTVTRKIPMEQYGSFEISAGYSKSYSKNQNPIDEIDKMAVELTNEITGFCEDYKNGKL